MTTSTIVEAAGRFLKRREQKEAQWRAWCRDIQSRVPRDWIVAVITAIKENSEAPLMQLPSPIRERAIVGFDDGLEALREMRGAKSFWICGHCLADLREFLSERRAR
jgi:hypothetical protein